MSETLNTGEGSRKGTALSLAQVMDAGLRMPAQSRMSYRFFEGSSPKFHSES